VWSNDGFERVQATKISRESRCWLSLFPANPFVAASWSARVIGSTRVEGPRRDVTRVPETAGVPWTGGESRRDGEECRGWAVSAPTTAGRGNACRETK